MSEPTTSGSLPFHTRPFPGLPSSAPGVHGALIRKLTGWLFRLGGWKFVGEFPDVPKLLLIAAPHSSAWDAYWGLLVKVAYGMNISFLAKRETFWFPLGPLLRWLGGMPIDRSSASGVVDQVVQSFADTPKKWVVLAPEGTRRAVTKWRSGFWHIAKKAKVPLCGIYFHYPERTIGVGPVFELTDDLDADLARIRAWYAPHLGKNRGV